MHCWTHYNLLNLLGLASAAVSSCCSGSGILCLELACIHGTFPFAAAPLAEQLLLCEKNFDSADAVEDLARTAFIMSSAFDSADAAGGKAGAPSAKPDPLLAQALQCLQGKYIPKRMVQKDAHTENLRKVVGDTGHRSASWWNAGQSAASCAAQHSDESSD